MNIGVEITKGVQDWQIVQQKNGFADIELEGTWNFEGKPKTEIEVSIRVVFEDTAITVIPWRRVDEATDNTWRTTIKKIPAGGLYRIETTVTQYDSVEIEWGVRGDMLHHIGVGDLYVISGQSNSAGYGREPVADPPEIGIHVCKNSGKWDLATHPLKDSTKTLYPENRESANAGHSPYLNFAKIIKKQVNYPIGLIQACLGGSALSLWNPYEDGVLYRAMLDIIKSQGGQIKGILWYQGCSDTSKDTCETYFDRFKQMVDSLRKELNDTDIHYLTVQLNRVLTGTDEIDEYWGKIRETQRIAAKKLHNVYVVPSTDFGLSDTIHNSSASNMVLGERMAKMALREIYGFKYYSKAPDIKKAKKVDDTTVQLIFDNVEQRLYLYEMKVKELPFVIKDDDGDVEIIEYSLPKENIIELKTTREIVGKAVIHGMSERNPKYLMPVDVKEYLPILSFYNVLVK